MKNIQDLAGIQLDIACGENKQAGFVGIDVRDLPGVDIVHDLNNIPWPLDDESCLRAFASHYVEHINPADFGFIKFMNEVWRILKPEAQFAIATPYAGSPGYWQDPTHINPCNEVTWAYFDPEATSKYGDGTLYRIYRPKPWKIQHLSWDVLGNIEVILGKREHEDE